MKTKIQKYTARKITSAVITVLFLFSQFRAYAYPSPQAPLPAGLISTTPIHKPWALKGMKIYPDDPLKFDFLLEEGDAKLSDDELKKESELFIKYFLAALTLPEEDLWVNLSPFEQDKIIPQATSQTEMGKGLLEQDYLLKRLVSSLTYPEADLGKSFWDKVYQMAYERFGTTKIPVNTFNKVWIVPDKAVVYEDGQRALIDESKLKVMMEQDYLAFKNSQQSTVHSPQTHDTRRNTQDAEVNDLSSQVMKEVVIPAIEQEVNQGENFATLRKMYHSFILASWFKKRLKESLLGQVYVDKKKTKGIDIAEPQLKEKVYQQYLQSYKEGLYNYIKTDYSPQERKHIKRKYWSGGIKMETGFSDSPVIQTKSVSSSLVNSFWNKAKNGLLVAVMLTTISLSSGNFNSVEADIKTAPPTVVTINNPEPGLFSKTIDVPKAAAYRLIANLYDLYNKKEWGALNKFLSVEALSVYLEGKKDYWGTVEAIIKNSNEGDAIPFTKEEVNLILDELSVARSSANSPLADNEGVGMKLDAQQIKDIEKAFAFGDTGALFLELISIQGSYGVVQLKEKGVKKEVKFDIPDALKKFFAQNNITKIKLRLLGNEIDYPEAINVSLQDNIFIVQHQLINKDPHIIYKNINGLKEYIQKSIVDEFAKEPDKDKKRELMDKLINIIDGLKQRAEAFYSNIEKGKKADRYEGDDFEYHYLYSKISSLATFLGLEFKEHLKKMKEKVKPPTASGEKSGGNQNLQSNSPLADNEGADPQGLSYPNSNWHGGGIALDQALLDLKTQGQFSGYKFDPAKLKEISANLAGFEPKIISIKKNGN